MAKHTICLLLFIAGCAPPSVVTVRAGPAIKTGLTEPSKAKVAHIKPAKIDPDQAVVDAFFKDVRATLKKGSKASSSKGYGFERGVWTLPTAWCVGRLALPKNKPLEDCMVREFSGRRAAVVTVVKDCEPEHCEVDHWIISGRSGLRPSPIALEHKPVVSPDNKYLFAGHTGVEPPAHGYRAYLVRVTLKTLETELVAACAAPTLSPSGRWLVCRDASGNVHRLPIGGGRLERVHTIDLGKDVIYSDPHIGVSLHPVQFIKKDRIRIFTLTAENKEDIEEAKWVDGP
jgi:hypothetical protein